MAESLLETDVTFVVEFPSYQSHQLIHLITLFHWTHQPTHDDLLANLLAKTGDLSDMWKNLPPDYLSGDVRGEV